MDWIVSFIAEKVAHFAQGWMLWGQRRLLAFIISWCIAMATYFGVFLLIHRLWRAFINTCVLLWQWICLNIVLILKLLVLLVYIGAAGVTAYFYILPHVEAQPEALDAFLFKIHDAASWSAGLAGNTLRSMGQYITAPPSSLALVTPKQQQEQTEPERRIL